MLPVSRGVGVRFQVGAFSFPAPTPLQTSNRIGGR